MPSSGMVPPVIQRIRANITHRRAKAAVCPRQNSSCRRITMNIPLEVQPDSSLPRPPLVSLASRGRRRHWLLTVGLLFPSFLLAVAGCQHAPPERPKKMVEVVVTAPVPDEVA